jgi:hypothetical protein
MIFPFTKKAKQKKILQKIRVKQDTIRKLEEEIKKMARLSLKDGKLTKIDDAPVPPQAPTEALPLPIEEYGNETIFDAMPQPPAQPMPMRVPPPPPPRPRGRPPMQPQQPQMPQYQPQSQPQQFYQPQPQQPQPPQPISIQIVMVNGQAFTLAVIPENFDAFISELTGAIGNRTVFIAGKHGINGAQIAWYVISPEG